jgi:hypothetical protein
MFFLLPGVQTGRIGRESRSRRNSLHFRMPVINCSIGPGSFKAIREDPDSETMLIVEPALLAQLNETMSRGNEEAVWQEKPKITE